MYVCPNVRLCSMCMLVPVKARIGCWVPWNWSYGRLRATMYVLGSEL